MLRRDNAGTIRGGVDTSNSHGRAAISPQIKQVLLEKVHAPEFLVHAGVDWRSIMVCTTPRINDAGQRPVVAKGKDVRGWAGMGTMSEHSGADAVCRDT